MSLRLVQADLPRRVEISVPDDVWDRLHALQTPGNGIANIMITASRFMLSEMDKVVEQEGLTQYEQA